MIRVGRTVIGHVRFRSDLLFCSDPANTLFFAFFSDTGMPVQRGTIPGL
jgi:hypothetical protein